LVDRSPAQPGSKDSGCAFSGERTACPLSRGYRGRQTHVFHIGIQLRVDRLVFKTMPNDSPKAQIFDGFAASPANALRTTRSTYASLLLSLGNYRIPESHSHWTFVL